MDICFRFVSSFRFTLRAAHPALLLLLHVQLRPLLLVWCSAFSSLKLVVLVFGRGAGSSLLQCVLVFFRAVCSTLLVLFHSSLLWWVLLVYSVRSTPLLLCALSSCFSLFLSRLLSHRVSIEFPLAIDGHPSIVGMVSPIERVGTHRLWALSVLLF